MLSFLCDFVDVISMQFVNKLKYLNKEVENFNLLSGYQEGIYDNEKFRFMSTFNLAGFKYTV